jgi:hypothetical protein
MPIALLLAAVLAPAAEDPAEVERLLHHGRVASHAPLGEGVTHSERVELEEGGRTLRAVFKTVDTRLSKMSYTFGSEKVDRYADSYRHELAAYALDKALGLGLVPPVVERKIGGKTGSLQVWVERTLKRFTPAAPPADASRAERQVHAMRFLDYLVYNTDRHVRNVVFGADWRVAAIDNSIAFHAFVKPFRPLYRFPRGPVERLRALDARGVNAALGRYLEGYERSALLKRREQVLRRVDAAVAAEGADAVLFDW